jgi:uracil-DNA glycosylase
LSISDTDEAEARFVELVAAIRACRVCVEAPVGRPLPHTPRPIIHGRASARIAICSQAPGTRVHASGRSFTDPSGVRLRSWLGLDEAEFYDESRVAIVPMGFCFPGLDATGGDLPPRKECAPRWHADVFRHLPNIELMLLIGRYAQVWHLGDAAGRSLSDAMAHWSDDFASRERPRRMALPHPSWRNNAWLKRNPWFEDAFVPRLQRAVRQTLDRPGQPRRWPAAAISSARPERS